MQEIRGPEDAVPPRGRPRSPSIRVPETGERIDLGAVLAAHQAAMTARLEEGLRAIHRSAARLMRQVAAEVWRTAGPEAGQNLQTGVIGVLARDDAMRGVLTHMDERYQAISLEIGKLEAALRKLASATGEAVRRTDDSKELVERVSQASQEQARKTRAGLAELARWIERSIQPLGARLESLEAALEAAAARQRAELAAFTERTGQGLAHVGRRLREGFAQMAERTAEENREALAELQKAVRAEMERLEAMARDEALRSGDTADRVAGWIEEIAGRTRASLDAVRDELIERVDATSVQTREAIERFAERFAGRLSELLAERPEEAPASAREAPSAAPASPPARSRGELPATEERGAAVRRPHAAPEPLRGRAEPEEEREVPSSSPAAIDPEDEPLDLNLNGLRSSIESLGSEDA